MCPVCVSYRISVPACSCMYICTSVCCNLVTSCFYAWRVYMYTLVVWYDEDAYTKLHVRVYEACLLSRIAINWVLGLAKFPDHTCRCKPCVCYPQGWESITLAGGRVIQSTCTCILRAKNAGRGKLGMGEVKNPRALLPLYERLCVEQYLLFRAA